MSSFRKSLQVFLPHRDKEDLLQDIKARGLSQQMVLEHYLKQELERIRKGQLPSYSTLPPAA